MQSPLNASASTAGNLLSSFTFEIPPYQREYSWRDDQVKDFWHDLSNSLNAESYFLGLIILTDETTEGKGVPQSGTRKQVVDGQQRLLTLTLLVKALQHEAASRNRQALADKLQMDFLRAIDYETDEAKPRIILTDSDDNQTLQHILDTGKAPAGRQEGVSQNIVDSYNFLSRALKEDLSIDPFRRLGQWAEFLKERLYFAVFLHPTAASAYTVFEVVNTRGKELTTADLLKNFVLSQTPPNQREEIYGRWREMAKSFTADSASNSFVQFIRHVVTMQYGHVLPKDLYSFIAQRERGRIRSAPTPIELVNSLESELPLYLQMIDPTLPGPATEYQLKTFRALNALGVMTVRPILMAGSKIGEANEVSDYTLRLVVRRIVVGNLGTGNVERKFGEAAKTMYQSRSIDALARELRELDPTSEDFTEQLRKRSFNKNTLTFLRRSIIQRNIAPDPIGTLHFIWPRGSAVWNDIQDEATTWGTTIGNTVLSHLDQRPSEATPSWLGFKRSMLNSLVEGELLDELRQFDAWTVASIENMGRAAAQIGVEVWY